MSSAIANLQREQQVYILEGNDFMVEKIQKLIDQEFKRVNNHNLNEVVTNESEFNIQKINEG